MSPVTPAILVSLSTSAQARMARAMICKIKTYGWIPDLSNHRVHLYGASQPVLAKLPIKVDLPPKYPPIFNQGELGSCTANAIAAAHQIDQVKKLATLICSLTLIGCTTISIVDQQGEVSISRNFGAIKIELNPGKHTTLAEVTGLGYLSGPLGTTLGFSKSSFAALGENCQLILWIKDSEQVQQLKNILANPENLCIISPISNGGPK